MFVLTQVSELVAACAILYRVKKRLSRSLNSLFQAAQIKNDLFDGVHSRLSYIQQANRVLENSLNTELALYEISKELSKFIDEEEILKTFKNEINRIFKVEECIFSDSPGLNKQDKKYSVFELKADSHKKHYVLIMDSGKADKAKILIMISQLELALKRCALYAKIQQSSIIDSLTGIAGRRHLLERLKQELLRSKRNSFKLSFLIIDVDNFKSFNDTYGHLAGDVILKEIAKVLKSSLRQIDLPARYGGEEFCVLLPETDKEGASLLAERFRQDIERSEVNLLEQSLKLTVSIGLATYPDDAQDVNPLIDTADTALYKAKSSGRNRVCLAGIK